MPVIAIISVDMILPHIKLHYAVKELEKDLNVNAKPGHRICWNQSLLITVLVVVLVGFDIVWSDITVCFYSRGGGWGN